MALTAVPATPNAKPPSDSKFGQPQVVVTAKGTPHKFNPSVNAVTVVVRDGDTANFNGADGKNYECRFYGIDAPETEHGKSRPGQSYGVEAGQALMKMLQAGQVSLEVAPGMGGGGGNKNKPRDLCKVKVEGKDVNLQLVKDGWAWVYKRYIHDRLELQKFTGAFNEAKQNKAGMNQGGYNREPYMHRKLYWPKNSN